jgi:tetratricopeptide (TPR) repeat protein
MPRRPGRREATQGALCEADWTRLEQAVLKLTGDAIADFADRHGHERFYGFAFDCNADYGDVQPCLNTEESLRASVARCRGRPPWEGATEAEIAARLRWNPGDWAYRAFADEERWRGTLQPFADRVQESVFAEDESDEDGGTPGRFLETVTRALLRLEKEGAFAPLRRTASFATLVIDHEEDEDEARARMRWLRLVLGERGPTPSEADRERADARAREALSRLEDDDEETAATLAAEALARDGDSPPAIVALGALALRRGDVERAGGAFTRALAATSRLTAAERADAHAGRGLVRMEDEAAAHADFEAALALEPEHDAALYGRGRLELMARRPAEALRSFDACLRADPGMTVARLFRSFAHAALGDDEQAQADRDRALGDDPDLQELAEDLDRLFGRRRRRRR